MPDKIKDIFDEYNLKARIFPAILCLFPFLNFYYFFVNKEAQNFFNLALNIQIFSGVSVSLILIYLLSNVNRYFSKIFIEKRIYNDELNMPTTNYLLHSGKQFPKDFLDMIYEKVYKDFKIKLSNINEEINDELNARQLIVESVGQIREKMKNGRLILKRNIEYGFFRNFIGGAIIALIVSIFDLIFFVVFNPNQNVLFISIVLVILYMLPVILIKPIMNAHSSFYARTLIREYMAAA